MVQRRLQQQRYTIILPRLHISHLNEYMLGAQAQAYIHMRGTTHYNFNNFVIVLTDILIKHSIIRYVHKYVRNQILCIFCPNV